MPLNSCITTVGAKLPLLKQKDRAIELEWFYLSNLVEGLVTDSLYADVLKLLPDSTALDTSATSEEHQRTHKTQNHMSNIFSVNLWGGMIYGMQGCLGPLLVLL